MSKNNVYDLKLASLLKQRQELIEKNPKLKKFQEEIEKEIEKFQGDREKIINFLQNKIHDHIQNKLIPSIKDLNNELAKVNNDLDAIHIPTRKSSKTIH